MAFDPLPQSWFPTMTDDDIDITLPIAELPELTAAEIDSTTGDVRKFLFAFCEKCWTVWNDLATADKSAMMTVAKSSSVNASTGIITHYYTMTFKNSISGEDVADEA